MPVKWTDEFWRFAGFGLLALLVGLLTGHVAIALLLYTLGYFGWYFYNLVRLEQWLRKGKKYAPPGSVGMWDEVYRDIYRMQQRNRKRNKRIVKLLNRFRESTAALPDGVVVLQGPGEIEWWNESAETLLGLKYPQDVNQRVSNLVRNPEFIEAYNDGSLTAGVNMNSPVKENAVLAVRLIPYGKKQALLIVRDDTIKQNVEQMRRDFVANISHELRTPLTVLSGYLESLGDGGDVKQGDWDRSVELMQQQAARMHRLVDDLVVLARLENEPLEASHETVVVPQFLATLREEAALISGPREHHFEWDVDDTLYLRGDAKELDSAFSNLVVNAINYTPAGGLIRVRWASEDDGAHFEVSDSGIGIAQHHLPRLTERFYRVDVARSRESGGSGLGLAIVKHVLSRHGAQLSIDSELGRGSKFACVFPAELVERRDNIYTLDAPRRNATEP
ncbi:MAG: phosphate regulon sensor histidine kinase PhoR [Pseudomonadota bacterium]|nr:MAG: phosphate regulon sensor histidine kinase PhoR [Pseudomonadota bacterium]